MLRFDEAATLPDPIDVDLLRDVVLYPERDNKHEADNERGADVIVHILGRLRQATKRLRSDHRQQDALPKGDSPLGRAEDHEAHGRQPVREALKGVKALHLPPGAPRRNPDPPYDQIGGAQNHDHAKDHDRAEPVQYDFVEIIPLPPGGLHEDAFPLVWLVDLSLDAWRLLK